MLGLFCKQPINATLHGVTNNNIDPSVDLIKTSMLSTLKKFILDDEDLNIRITKRGQYDVNLFGLTVIKFSHRYVTSWWW
jgi:RNA 3'-terminal phosphate cyclase